MKTATKKASRKPTKIICKNLASTLAECTKPDNRLAVMSGTGAVTYGSRGDKRINGKIRTYLPGKLDDRVLPFRRLKTAYALAQHIVTENPEPVIAKVEHIKEATGWTERDFAPVI